MDTFNEKLVTKKKDARDYLLNAAVITAAIILIFISLNIQILSQIWLVIAAGLIYGAYYLISSRNIEYEYIVTNGDLDIDRIVARRRRKRIFSASCKEFDIVARVKSSSFSPQVQSVKNRIMAAGSLDSDNAYFIDLNYKGERTVVIFEPNDKMLESFKLFIPRKVLMS